MSPPFLVSDWLFCPVCFPSCILIGHQLMFASDNPEIRYFMFYFISLFFMRPFCSFSCTMSIFFNVFLICICPSLLGLVMAFPLPHCLTGVRGKGNNMLPVSNRALVLYSYCFSFSSWSKIKDCIPQQSQNTLCEVFSITYISHVSGSHSEINNGNVFGKHTFLLFLQTDLQTGKFNPTDHVISLLVHCHPEDWLPLHTDFTGNTI